MVNIIWMIKAMMIIDPVFFFKQKLRVYRLDKVDDHDYRNDHDDDGADAF